MSLATLFRLTGTGRRLTAPCPVILLAGVLLTGAAVLCAAALSAGAQETKAAQPVEELPRLHAIAMYGEPAEPADYTHLSYANPDAPQGGRISHGVIGTFDSLNPFILKSMRTTARGMWDPELGSNMVFESLMVRSYDEPFTLYGLLAESVQMPDDRSWITFHLNPKARWHDGMPVTPEDVIFTYELLTEKGRPPFSSRTRRIEKIEKTGEHSVRFTFNDQSDREFPLIVAAFTPVLPKHAIDPGTFDASTLEPMLGSGPYKLAEIDPGKKVVYRKDPGYWGKDLPVHRGFFNFDEVAIEYFTQAGSRFEAFKKGIVDIYKDGDPAHWERAYDFPAVTDGEVVKKEFFAGDPANMLAFIFNTRRKLFADRELREALSNAFDFEKINRNLFFNAYKRTTSFWEGSELASTGRPASDTERELLGDAAGSIQPEILAGTWQPAVTDGSGSDRAVLRKVFSQLKKAGYKRDGSLLVTPDGEPVAFEVMTRDVSEEKLALSFKDTLARLGITLEVRTVDDAQYQKRLQTFDYDMIVGAYSASLSPGIEQLWRWGSEARDAEGSFNYAGIADPAIDRLIETMVGLRSREDFTAAVRALDRLLLSGHYAIPLYHLPGERYAHRAYLAYPEKTALYGNQYPVWWHK